LYDFYNCKLKSQNGKFRRVECKLAKGQVAGVPQLLALEEWAASLEKGQVVAVRVDESEAGKYNGQTYYLALVLGLAFELRLRAWYMPLKGMRRGGLWWRPSGMT
jgi:hypothetical protein